MPLQTNCCWSSLHGRWRSHVRLGGAAVEAQRSIGSSSPRGRWRSHARLGWRSERSRSHVRLGVPAVGAGGGRSSPRGLRTGGAALELTARLANIARGLSPARSGAVAELPRGGRTRRGGGARGSRSRRSGARSYRAMGRRRQCGALPVVSPSPVAGGARLRQRPLARSLQSCTGGRTRW